MTDMPEEILVADMLEKPDKNSKIKYIRADLVAQYQKDIDAIWCAWYEMNAIRARDGAPECVCQDYWSDVVDRLESMLPEKYQKPWHPKYTRAKEKDNGSNSDI